MLVIRSLSTEPAFNLAAEEYLFRNFNDDVFFLYINSPAVVVGKHQNAMAEINPFYVAENKVKVIRRLSGGGAVYHDLGNLNFSFHQTVPDTSKISFKKFNEPIVEVLHQLDIAAEVGQRNDIFVDGYKVSGHAEHVFRNRVLSHGTLLFNADREALSQALKNPSFDHFQGKAIQSVRSKVANISEFLAKPITIGQFSEMIQQHVMNSFQLANKYEFNRFDLEKIEQLATEKYSTREWNFGYSPKYRFVKSVVSQQRTLDVVLTVEKGIIIDVEIKSTEISEHQMRNIHDRLINVYHNYSELESALNTKQIDQLIRSTLLKCLF